MTQQLIFEIGTEEIPAGYLDPALEQLKHNMATGLDELHLAYTEIKGAATPRRLVLCVEGLSDCQPDKTEEMMGPPKSAAFDSDNKPTKAAEGFAKSKGASLEDIQIVTTPKGEYLMIRQDKKGQKTTKLLPDFLINLIKTTPFPKSMRWGASKTTFARPIQWLLAKYSNQTVSFSLEGAGESGSVTYGHRFMAPDSIEITDYQQYINDLRANHVLVNTDERRQKVIEEINSAAGLADGSVLPDEELVKTVANLVETPHAVCGTFDNKFLELPKDALITSMREHQKYFAVVDEHGNLKPNFIAVNNTKVKDLNLAAEGHQRVLRARLEDGLFFFKEDQSRTLADRVNDLKGIIFQAKLGTMLDKTKRIQILAGFIASHLLPEKTEQVERAAYLAKADLLTEMVNEFPSLQGAMGRDYATLNGEPPEVAAAIHQHYMPVRAGSPLPESLIGSIVSIADRLDTIAGCFGIGQVPSGTADPFGLRRQSLGLIHVILHNKFSISLPQLIDKALRLYGDKLTEDVETASRMAIEFIKGRFVNDQVSTGAAPEAVEAVTSVIFEDIVDCQCRIQALITINAQPSFAILAGAFKRVMNIIKEHDAKDVAPELFSAEEEKQLHETYLSVKQKAQPLINTQNYAEALDEILKTKEAVDLFFDKVMVMTDDIDVRQNRLNLLSAVASLFLQVGDFSKMNK